MEELVSADAIKSEIAEDARKKAERILAEADEESARIFEESAAKAVAVVDDIYRTSAAGAARFRMETLARLPLERTRMRTAFVDARLREALAAYLDGLSEGEIARLCGDILAEARTFLGDVAVRVSRRGLSENAARAAVARGGARAESVAEDPGLPGRGLVVEALDGSARLRATMDLVGDGLLDLRRAELARALCADAMEARP